jgi:hypothetical protein
MIQIVINSQNFDICVQRVASKGGESILNHIADNSNHKLAAMLSGGELFLLQNRRTLPFLPFTQGKFRCWCCKDSSRTFIKKRYKKTLGHPKTISLNTQSIVDQINYKTRVNVVLKSGKMLTTD